MGVHKDDKGSKHNTGHNTGHNDQPKKKGLISTIRARNRELARVARETAPRSTRAVRKARPSNGKAVKVEGTPEQIARRLNIQRIKSASKDTARKRSLLAQLRGLRKRSKRGPGFEFIEGKSKF